MSAPRPSWPRSSPATWTRRRPARRGTFARSSITSSATARWWAVTVTGEGGAPDADYAAGDFAAAYQESIGIATAAFETDGVLEKTVRLPFGEFPGAALLSLAATEQFTHSWDLARALGHHTDLDPELAAGLLSQARLAITDPFRGPDGEALFGSAQEAPAGAGPADQLAAFLGRPV